MQAAICQRFAISVAFGILAAELHTSGCAGGLEILSHRSAYGELAKQMKNGILMKIGYLETSGVTQSSRCPHPVCASDARSHPRAQGTSCPPLLLSCATHVGYCLYALCDGDE